ncbi:hypothetical protein MMC14_000129 [Varicellaria rhodocarpa]|nr:hypothetical protein [Varicellaria rhodocarpa]
MGSISFDGDPSINLNVCEVIEPARTQHPIRWLDHTLHPDTLNWFTKGNLLDVLLRENENSGLLVVRRGVPAHLMYYYCPGLRQPLKVEPRARIKQIVLFRNVAFSVAWWAIQWMMRGGKSCDITHSVLLSKASIWQRIDEALGRIRLFADLAMAGTLQNRLLDELPRLLAMKVDYAPRENPYFNHIIRWAYGTQWVNGNEKIREKIVDGIIRNLYDHDFVEPSLYPMEYAPAYRLLKVDLRSALFTSTSCFSMRGHRCRTLSLSINQLRFIYQYSTKNMNIRKYVACRLLHLIASKVLQAEPYMKYAWHNREFSADMFNACMARNKRLGIIWQKATQPTTTLQSDETIKPISDPQSIKLEEHPLARYQLGRACNPADNQRFEQTCMSLAYSPGAEIFLKSSTAARKRRAEDPTPVVVKKRVVVANETVAEPTRPTSRNLTNDIKTEATDDTFTIVDLTEIPPATKVTKKRMVDVGDDIGMPTPEEDTVAHTQSGFSDSECKQM